MQLVIINNSNQLALNNKKKINKYKLERWKNMQKSVAINVLIILVAFSISACYALTEEDSIESEISLFTELYEGISLSPDTIHEIHSSFDPVGIDFPEVHVTLDEVLFDGKTLSTAASVVATDTDTIMIMPGSAQLNESVSGGYGENMRNDFRSFKEAALEDGKRVICVYAYPKEFDELGCYALDHLQMTDDRSILYSSAEFNDIQSCIVFNWLIQIYSVDLITGEYKKINETFVPITISSIQRK